MKTRLLLACTFLVLMMLSSSWAQTVNKCTFSSFHPQSPNDSVLIAGGQVASAWSDVSPAYYAGYYPLTYSLLDIPDYPSQPLSVYPNPFSDELHIRFGTAPSGTATIRLFSMQGQLILERNTAADCLLQTDDLTPGIYLLIISINGANPESHKLVKY